MLDSIPINPKSKKENEVVSLTMYKTMIPPISPMIADRLPTRGKKIPRMNKAPSPLVSNPKKVLNWSQREAISQVARTIAISVPTTPTAIPENRAIFISERKEEFGKKVL